MIGVWGFGVRGLGFNYWGLGIRVLGFGLGILVCKHLRCRACGLGFGVRDFRWSV